MRADTLQLLGADEGYFGERVAAVYDEHSAGMFDPAVAGPVVEMLAELAGDGTALVNAGAASLATPRQRCAGPAAPCARL